MARKIKIGDDFPVSVKNVTLAEDGQYLPGAAIAWELKDRLNATVDDGTATLFIAETAWFKFHIPKAVTALLDVAEPYRLDVIFTHAGIQVSKSIDLVASLSN